MTDETNVIAVQMADVLAQNTLRQHHTYPAARVRFIRSIVTLINAYCQFDPSIRWAVMNELKRKTGRVS